MTTTDAAARLTHHVRLILDNDEGVYNARRELVERAIATNRPIGNHWGVVSEKDREQARRLTIIDTASGLEHLYRALCGLEDDFGVAEPTLAATEVLSTALAFVSWHELAEDYLDEHEDEA